MVAVVTPLGCSRRLLATLFSAPLTSRLVGHLADRRPPKAVLLRLIRAYSRVFRIDLAEAEQPPEAFTTFNEFFTRRLAPGKRPIDQRPGVVVSPSDSELVSLGAVPKDGRLEQIKGSDYSLEALLGSAEEARLFATGLQATLYLSPAMYHRVHAPVSGRIRAWRHIPGRLFPVNRLGLYGVPGLFTRNERVVVSIDSEEQGRVAVVLVGAAHVGRISLAFTDLVTNRGRWGGFVQPDQPIPLARGDELGTFNLGSTVVLLVADAAHLSVASAGRLVRVGQPLWQRSG